MLSEQKINTVDEQVDHKACMVHARSTQSGPMLFIWACMNVKVRWKTRVALNSLTDQTRQQAIKSWENHV